MSVPAPRSMVPPVMAVAERDGVGIGAAGDGLDVGDGGGVGEVAEGQLSVPAPRLMVPLVSWWPG